MAEEPYAVATPADEPVGNPAEATGEPRFDTEQVQRVLGHGRAGSLRSARSGLTGAAAQPFQLAPQTLQLAFSFPQARLGLICPRAGFIGFGAGLNSFGAGLVHLAIFG